MWLFAADLMADIFMTTSANMRSHLIFCFLQCCLRMHISSMEHHMIVCFFLYSSFANSQILTQNFTGIRQRALLNDQIAALMNTSSWAFVQFQMHKRHCGVLLHSALVYILLNMSTYVNLLSGCWKSANIGRRMLPGSHSPQIFKREGEHPHVEWGGASASPLEILMTGIT